MKGKLFTILLGSLALTGVANATVLFPTGGGTGIGDSGVTTTDIGKVLTVSSSNPFTYKFVTPTAGSGGGGADQRVNTSTANYLAVYLTGTSVTGTPLAQLTAGTLTFSSTTVHTNISATSATSTNLYVSSLANLVGLTFGTAVGTSVTTTNLMIFGALKDNTGSQGSDGMVLKNQGGTSTLWVPTSSLGYLTIGGGENDVQFNLSGGLSGTAAFQFYPASNTLYVHNIYQIQQDIAGDPTEDMDIHAADGNGVPANLNLTAGSGVAGVGADVILTGGFGTSNGYVSVRDPSTGFKARLDAGSLSADTVFTFPSYASGLLGTVGMGTVGYVLQTDGTTASWVSTSSLEFPVGGGGGSFTTTTINGLTTTAYTFVGAGGMTITTSGPGTVTFTQGAETDPIFSAYPAFATSSFLYIGFQALASSTYLTLGYTADATSTFVSKSATTSFPNLTVVGTIANLVFGNATGTNLNISASSTFRTSTIAGGFFQTDMSDCSGEGSTLNYNATTGKFTCLSDAGGGGGTVNSGLANQVTYYDVNGTAVSGTSTIFFSPLKLVGIGTTTFPSVDAAKLTIDTGGTLSREALYIEGSIDDFLESNIRNLSTGTSAQSCTTVTGALGTLTYGFASMCMNSPNFNSSTLFNIGKGNDANIIFNTVGNGYIALVSATGSLYFSVGNTTSLQGIKFSISSNASDGFVSAYQYPINQPTTTNRIVLSDPDSIPTITLAGIVAIYSDDITRMIQVATATASSNLQLRNGSFANVAQVYFGTTAQTATNVVLGGIGTKFNGAITAQGYHYVFMSTSTRVSGGITGSFVRRATSSPNINIALAASWPTSTWSGLPATSTASLVGFSTLNGVPTLWFSSSTTQLVPYSINTSTNTLTRGTTVTITGANSSILGTRVNENGIYAQFTPAPFMRKYTHAGVAVGGISNYLVAVPANGPDVFVTPYSMYALAGGSTTNLTRLIGY